MGFDISVAKDVGNTGGGGGNAGSTAGTGTESETTPMADIIGTSIFTVDDPKEAIVPLTSAGTAVKWKELQGTLDAPSKIKVTGQNKRKVFVFIDNVGLTIAERVSEELGYGVGSPGLTTGQTYTKQEEKIAKMMGTYEDPNSKFDPFAGTLPIIKAEGAGVEVFEWQGAASAADMGTQGDVGITEDEAATVSTQLQLGPSGTGMKTFAGIAGQGALGGKTEGATTQDAVMIALGQSLTGDEDKDFDHVPKPPGYIQMALPGIKDTFRHYAAKYWVFDAETIEGSEAAARIKAGVSGKRLSLKFLNPMLGEQSPLIPGTGTQEGSLLLNPAHSPFSHINVFNKRVVANKDKESAFFQSLRESIIVHSNTSVHAGTKWTDSNWAAFINGKSAGVLLGNLPWAQCVKLRETFWDCPFEIATPFHENEISNVEARKTSFLKLEPVYNYYIPKYEEMAGLPWLKEALLPNVQVVSAIYDDIKPENFLNLTATGSGYLHAKFLGQKGNSTDPSHISANYFNKFADRMNKLANKATNIDGTLTAFWQKQITNIVSLERQFSNIVIPYVDTDLLSNAEDKKRFFPMYFKLEFSTDTSTEFADTLKSTPFGMHLMIRIVKDIIEFGEHKLGTQVGMPAVEFSEVSFIQPNDFGDPLKEKRFAAGPRMLRQWNLEKWLAQSGIMYWDFKVVDENLFQKMYSVFGHFTFLSKYYSKAKLKKDLDGATGGALTGTEGAAGNFSQILYSLIFKNKLIEFVHSKFRSFAEVLSGTMAYSETFLYRIKKTPLGNVQSDGTVLRHESRAQNIWIPNTNELDIVRYLDTQVKYGVEYEYEIFAYQMVIGSRYQYKRADPGVLAMASSPSTKTAANIAGQWIGSDATGTNPGLLGQFSGAGQPNFKGAVFNETTQINTTGAADTKGAPVFAEDEVFVGKHVSGGYNAIFGVESFPKVTLLEVSYGKVVSKIIDHAPIAPEIDIVPYHGVNNRLLVNLNGGLGEYKAKPIYIETNDHEKIQERIDLETGLVHYKSDDSASNSWYFEIYRTDTVPLSYDDFRGTRIAIADPESLLDVQKGGVSTASFLDTTIRPNKTYWYMFRTLDAHENLSNPSAVYQIEIVDDGVSMYMTNKIFDFPTKVKNLRSKSIKKYFQIDPAHLQGILQKDFSVPLQEDVVDILLSQAKLGTRNQSLWGKKFKIRFTSKQTGRKIDLNIDFKIKRLNKGGKFIKGVESFTNPNK